VSLAADQRLDRAIERGELGGAFFLHGDAVRLRDEAARRLAEAALDPGTRDFNFDIFRGAETSPEALAASLAMPPVMAPRRVVALYGAERLTPTGCDVIEEALKSLPPDLTLIVTATIPKGSRKAFYRRLKEGALSLEWTAPKDAEIPGWLMERARRTYGVQLSVPAAEALAGAIGSDLGVLDAELEKLCGASERDITVERVAELVPNVREVNRWAWLDRVASREYAMARRELPALLAGDEGAVGLIGGMVDHHIYLGIALEGGARLVERTLSDAGKPYLRFKAATFARQARMWSKSEIEHALRNLRQADARSKSSAADGDAAVLEELLLRLEHRAGAGRRGAGGAA
jgi:DNA polymerase-3 subunit delta